MLAKILGLPYVVQRSMWENANLSNQTLVNIQIIVFILVIHPAQRQGGFGTHKCIEKLGFHALQGG